MEDVASYIEVNSKNLYDVLNNSSIGTFLHFLDGSEEVIISNNPKQLGEIEVKTLEDSLDKFNSSCMKVKDYLLKDNKAELVHYEVFFENNSLYNTYKNLYQNFEEKLN